MSIYDSRTTSRPIETVVSLPSACIRGRVLKIGDTVYIDDGLEWVEVFTDSAAAGAFTDLSDVPASFTSQALKVLRVNAAETAIEFVTLAGGGDMLSTNNLSDVASAATARTNLGLGTAAVQNVGAFFQVANDLSECDPAIAQVNLELSTRAQFDTACGDGNFLFTGDAPTAHAASHKLGGGDVILLNEFGNPTASVEFNQQQALQFRIENRTSDPGAPAVGEIWLRTDL